MSTPADVDDAGVGAVVDEGAEVVDVDGVNEGAAVSHVVARGVAQATTPAAATRRAQIRVATAPRYPEVEHPSRLLPHVAVVGETLQT